MTFQASLHLDTMRGRNGNEYQRLLNALHQAGWEYAETSAMALIDGEWHEVLLALELLAKGLPAVREISSLALQVQAVGPIGGEPPAADNHRRALDRVLGYPNPSELS